MPKPSGWRRRFLEGLELPEDALRRVPYFEMHGSHELTVSGYSRLAGFTDLRIDLQLCDGCMFHVHGLSLSLQQISNATLRVTGNIQKVSFLTEEMP